MNIQLAAKSPPDVDSWGLMWDKFLAKNDYIVGVTIMLCAGDTSGVVLFSPGFTADTTYCGVSGGTVGKTAKIEHAMTTAAGAKWTKTVEIEIVAEC